MNTTSSASFAPVRISGTQSARGSTRHSLALSFSISETRAHLQTRWLARVRQSTDRCSTTRHSPRTPRTLTPRRQCRSPRTLEDENLVKGWPLLRVVPSVAIFPELVSRKGRALALPFLVPPSRLRRPDQ